MPFESIREVESSAHWGTFVAEVSEDGRLLDARPHTDDPDAAPAIANVADANRSRARVSQPSVRRRWLERGPGPDDRDPWVSWQCHQPTNSSHANTMVEYESWPRPSPSSIAGPVCPHR